MGENKEYVMQAQKFGSVNISIEVVSSIAAMAAHEVDGVCGLAASMGTDIAELLGKKSLSKGVKVTMLDEGIDVVCNVVLYYGYSIPETSAKIQDEVSAALESMTGLRVHSVNVNVCGISLNEQTQ